MMEWYYWILVFIVGCLFGIIADWCIGRYRTPKPKLDEDCKEIKEYLLTQHQ